jgi:hypothetical protein
MKRLELADSTRALAAGAICLAILGGMLVGHAWPLWTGEDVLLTATVDGTRTWTSGQYVMLSTAADTLMVDAPLPTDTVPRTMVHSVAPWVKRNPQMSEESLDRRLRGRTIYVQLARQADGTSAPVSVSLEPVAGAVNLRGMAVWAYGSGELKADYGIDAFYMQEGHAAAVEQAFNEHRPVQLQVAITRSGQARIRNLLVGGAAAR